MIDVDHIAHGRSRTWLPYLAAAMATFALAWLSITLTRGDGRIAALWPVNAVLLAVVLQHGSRHMVRLLGAGWVGNVTANLLIGDAPALGLTLAFANTVEVTTCAVLLFKLVEGRIELHRPRHLIIFLVVAGVAAPATSGLVAAPALHLLASAPFFPTLKFWFLSDALGLLSITPALLMLNAANLRSLVAGDAWRQSVVLFAVLATVLATVFLQSRYPLLFLVPTALVAIAYRSGHAGAALALLMTGLAGSLGAIFQVGPMMLIPGAMKERVLFQQGFLLVMALSALFAAAAVMHRRRLQEESDAAKRAAEEERNRYSLLAEHSNDMIVRIGLDGVRRYVSPACRKLLGYEPEAMIGGAPVAAIHADDRARVVDVCRTLLTGADEPMCSYRQQHRDGRYVWLEATYRLVRNDAGEPVELVASVRDVSRRQAVEHQAAEAAAKRQESHRLLTMATAIAGVGHWRVDLIRGEVVWSETVFGIYGLPLEHVPTLENAIEPYHPDDREVVRAHVERATRTGEPFAYTARLLLPDRAERTVRVQGQAERAPDKSVVGLVGVMQDITDQVAAEAALRESEAQHRFLSDHATDVIGRLDLESRCLYVSPSIRELTGHPPQALIGVDMIGAMHPDDAAEVRVLYGSLARGEMERLVVDYRTPHRDGRMLWAEASLRLVRDRDGDPQEVVSVVRDISGRKALEAELTAARDKAEAATKAKADFLANMSHEIRTPLNGILGFAELLEVADLQPVHREWVGRIRTATSDLGMLLNDILDASKIEAGRLEVGREPMDLRSTVEGAAHLLVSAAEQKGLLLRTAIDPALPPAMLGDSLRLRQVLLNLVGNAVKFTEDGVVTVTAARVDGPDQSWLQVEVRDTGIGMTADALSRVFESFEQADGTIARRFGGTGLGLAISRSLVELMGGELTLDSAPGLGTRARLRLPLVEADLPAHGGSDQTSGASSSVGRILVVDDVDMNREVVSLLLKGAGHQVELCAGGADAVECVRKSAFDLILMDMQMPGVDGLEATRRIRALPGAPGLTPILAFTANAMPEQVLACRAAGMDGHVSKPVKRPDLLSAVSSWLRRPAVCEAQEAPADDLAKRMADLTEGYRSQLLVHRQALDQLLAAPRGELALETLYEISHGIAGTAGSLGFGAVSAAAFDLQREARSGEPHRLGDLRMATERLRAEIEQVATARAA